MDSSTMAKALGSLGGKARAKRLTAERKKEIAQLGAKARVESLLALKRLRANFNYLKAIKVMSPKNIKVKRLKTARNKLPGIYRNAETRT